MDNYYQYGVRYDGPSGIEFKAHDSFASAHADTYATLIDGSRTYPNAVLVRRPVGEWTWDFND